MFTADNLLLKIQTDKSRLVTSTNDSNQNFFLKNINNVDKNSNNFKGTQEALKKYYIQDENNNTSKVFGNNNFSTSLGNLGFLSTTKVAIPKIQNKNVFLDRFNYNEREKYLLEELCRMYPNEWEFIAYKFNTLTSRKMLPCELHAYITDKQNSLKENHQVYVKFKLFTDEEDVILLQTIYNNPTDSWKILCGKYNNNSKIFYVRTMATLKYRYFKLMCRTDVDIDYAYRLNLQLSKVLNLSHEINLVKFIKTRVKSRHLKTNNYTQEEKTLILTLYNKYGACMQKDVNWQLIRNKFNESKVPHFIRTLSDIKQFIANYNKSLQEKKYLNINSNSESIKPVEQIYQIESTQPVIRNTVKINPDNKLESSFDNRIDSYFNTDTFKPNADNVTESEGRNLFFSQNKVSSDSRFNFLSDMSDMYNNSNSDNLRQLDTYPSFR